MDPIPCIFAERKDIPDRGWFLQMPNGALLTESELPAGTMFFRPARYTNCEHEPRCTEHLIVVCPKSNTDSTRGGHWDVDSICGNCTMPTNKTHRCWVRHGDPRSPLSMHVDKNGFTCAAGAGSIQAGNYHGYLHHGHLINT